MTMRPKVPNQLSSSLMGVSSLNPWDMNDSSSRKQMIASHVSQALVISGSTERYCQTGMENEYAKYTFSIKIPDNMEDPESGVEIIRIIERYRNKVGSDSISFNPQRIIIYEDVNTKELGMINIPNYCSYHQYFGFEYKPTEALSQIRVGAFVKAGTILLDSPSVTPNGGYKFGRECNVAFMTHPSVSEDGIMVCRDVLPFFSFKTYETRIVECGSKFFPLNLYGDAENFKPFPDIGDRIRPDGLLMCLRSYDKELSVVEQNVNDLMEPDFIFDKCTYAGGEGGRVIDIRVHHDPKNTQAGIPQGMEVQLAKYDQARHQFYQDIVHEYSRLKHDRRESLRITPEFHRMVVEALSVIDAGPQRIAKLYRQAPLDDWRIEFVVEYETIPDIGFKATDLHG